MRGTQWLLAAVIATASVSGSASAENILISKKATRLEWRVSPLFRGALCAFAERYDQTIAACEEALRSDTNNCRAYALRGYAHLFKKHSSKLAIADFSEVLRHDPSNTAIHIARARAYLQDKDDDRAIADFSEAIRLDPRCSDAYSRRGKIYLVSKRAAGKGLADYSTTLRLDPGRIRTRLNRADVFRQKGEYARTLADLEIVFRDEPDNEIARFIRGQVYLDQQDFTQAKADASELIRLYPTNSLGYTLQSQISLVCGEGGKCLFSTVAGIVLQPGRIKIRSQPATETTLGGFTIGSEDGPPPNPSDDERIAACTKRLRDDPNNVAAYWERACAYDRKHDYERAVADFDKIICRDTADAEAYYERGHAYLHLKAYAKAIDDFNRAIQLDSDNADRYFGRGLAYEELKKVEEALRDFVHAIDLDARFAEVHVFRGWLHYHRQEDDKAIADLTEALRLSPAHPVTYAMRATVFLHQGKYDRTIADCKQVLRFDPRNNHVRDCLARYLATCPDACLRNGKQAREYATAACEETEWRDPKCLDTLAAACAECGDFDRAIKWQSKVLELAPQTYKNYYRRRLELYRSHKPYHESPTHTASASSSAN